MKSVHGLISKLRRFLLTFLLLLLLDIRLTCRSFHISFTSWMWYKTRAVISELSNFWDTLYREKSRKDIYSFFFVKWTKIYSRLKLAFWETKPMNEWMRCLVLTGKLRGWKIEQEQKRESLSVKPYFVTLHKTTETSQDNRNFTRQQEQQREWKGGNENEANSRHEAITLFGCGFGIFSSWQEEQDHKSGKELFFHQKVTRRTHAWITIESRVYSSSWSSSRSSLKDTRRWNRLQDCMCKFLSHKMCINRRYQEIGHRLQHLYIQS